MVQWTMKHLSENQITTYLREGVLVVDSVLSRDEIDEVKTGMSQSLLRYGVDTERLVETGRGLCQLSTTNGSGGVLDIFYEEWKVRVASSPKLFALTTELWDACYCHNGEGIEDLPETDRHKWHPYGAFDSSKGYIYLDRVGYRLPTTIAESIGEAIEAEAPRGRKKKRSKAIQRSLTPHLDCCPDSFFNKNATKWRPIQCFVSLTDNKQANHGGFEAAKGFHREFDDWRQQREPTKVTRKGRTKGEVTVEESIPAPCIGEYTHIRPTEDAEVMDRINHIPVSAGSAVFWDNRIPHANAYRHTGNMPRIVVYCSFLPDIPLNRKYAAMQLENWKKGRNPSDQWIEKREDNSLLPSPHDMNLSPLARRLLAIND